RYRAAGDGGYRWLGAGGGADGGRNWHGIDAGYRGAGIRREADRPGDAGTARGHDSGGGVGGGSAGGSPCRANRPGTYVVGGLIMSFLSRLRNVFRGDGLSREIDEELEAHIAEAIEEGRDAGEARRAFGSALRRRDESRDIRLVPWLGSLRADAVFGWRQLMKKKATSAAAILSLALAIGSCTSAFRLIDAILLRPLPVADPERLYAVSRQEFRLAADGQ